MKTIFHVLLASFLSATPYVTAAPPVDKTALLEVLALHETQLAAAEHDLEQAQATLREEGPKQKATRNVGILITASGLAGMALVAHYRIAPTIRFAELFGASFVVSVSGVTVVYVASSKLAQAEALVAERLELVRMARKKVSGIKKQINPPLDPQ